MGVGGVGIGRREGSYPGDRRRCCLSDQEEVFKLVIVRNRS